MGRAMNIQTIRCELVRQQAIIVHCSRPGRDGEIGAPKPLYPDDLRQTIGDLDAGGVRPVSCSVIWPGHQETFGDVGIIVAPRTLADIKLMHSSDAGYSEQLGGFGGPPSPKALAATFEQSSGHNEWVMVGADVTGLFVKNLTPSVARRMPPPDELSESERAMFGEPIVGCPTTVEAIATDFPSLPIFTFRSGSLVKLIERPKAS